MTAKHWKYLAIALIAANVLYWLIMPVWNWKMGVERELFGITQAIARAHPELVSRPAPQQQESEEKAEQ